MPEALTLGHANISTSLIKFEHVSSFHLPDSMEICTELAVTNFTIVKDRCPFRSLAIDQWPPPIPK